MKQTIEIEVPEGKEAIWKDGRVYFIDKPLKLPKTWEEYCETNPVCNKEYYIDTSSEILTFYKGHRKANSERNLLETEEDAKAHLALIQLHRLRDYYRQGWVPKDKEDNHVIQRYKDGTYSVFTHYSYSSFLSFQSKEIAKEFLTNFRDLIEQAGDLI